MSGAEQENEGGIEYIDEEIEDRHEEIEEIYGNQIQVPYEDAVQG